MGSLEPDVFLEGAEAGKKIYRESEPLNKLYLVGAGAGADATAPAQQVGNGRELSRSGGTRTGLVGCAGARWIGR